MKRYTLFDCRKTTESYSANSKLEKHRENVCVRKKLSAGFSAKVCVNMWQLCLVCGGILWEITVDFSKQVEGKVLFFLSKIIKN